MNLKLAENEKKYFNFIRELRNLNVNEGFTEKCIITEEQQIKYMEKYEKNYYICLLDDHLPVGFIGQINGDIRLATSPDHFGKGIGLFMVENFMRFFPKSFAKIGINNIASQNLFKKAGFKTSFVIMEKNDT